jgi:hypothetical protein
MESKQQDISRAVRVLMDASPEFRAAMERAAQQVAKIIEVFDTPEGRKALESAGAKVAEFDQATKRIANGDDEPPALEAS